MFAQHTIETYNLDTIVGEFVWTAFGTRPTGADAFRLAMALKADGEVSRILSPNGFVLRTFVPGK